MMAFKKGLGLYFLTGAEVEKERRKAVTAKKEERMRQVEGERREERKCSDLPNTK